LSKSRRSLVGRAHAFLDKSADEKVKAVKRLLARVVKRPGVGPSGELFAQRIAGEMETIRDRLQTLAIIERERYVKEILSDGLYHDRRRLLPFGFKMYSQTDEDGIIQEIFARIGIRSKIFVEFGVGNGLENNTLKLLLEGWSGLWMEGSAEHVAHINGKFDDVIRQGRLHVQSVFIDRDNVNGLIGRFHTGEIDLLSIDVDGNDIYLLEVLQVVSPRVIVIEYNGKFPPPLSIAQAYDAAYRWQGTDYSGASLAAITKVAERKGYSLVGCNILGVNAFFVRQDLLEDKFCPPYTAENHYQPARYNLWPTFVAGHPPDWGPYVTV
jgi:hypothetical protein